MTVPVTALLTGLAALVLSTWMQRVASSSSSWLRSGAHVALAALGGAGAAVLADTWAELVAFALLALACALLVVIDLASHRLPDVIVGPMYLVLFTTLAVAAGLAGEWDRLGRAAGAGAVLAVGYLALAVISPTGLGLGDVKLAGLLGAFLGWLGWSHVLTGALAAFVVGGLVAGALLLAGRASRETHIAFGPWMVTGAVLGAAWGPATLG